MESFTLRILGCGSAKPTRRHRPACQIVDIHGHLCMIDCGEGSQLQMCRYGISTSRLRHIFISHLHGDHCFGLMGLLCTMSLEKRLAPIDIYGPQGLADYFKPQLAFYAGALTFPINLHVVSTTEPQEVVVEKGYRVTSFPLRHRVDCVGYRIDEAQPLPHILPDMIKCFEVPHYAIRAIKEGADWTTPDGRIIPHERFVRPARQPRAYAYCSDTASKPDNAPLLQNLTLLYHEATYAEEHAGHAHEVGHSTAREAAEIATLCKPKQLLIGHFSSRYNDEDQLLKEAVAVFPETILAHEGMTIELT